ncbi:MAG TPA: 30S ribosomal protein S5 [Candidatus Paceibacterota bacterium]
MTGTVITSSAPPAPIAPAPEAKRGPRLPRGTRSNQRGQGGGRPTRGPRGDGKGKPRSDLDQRTLSVRRVTRVGKGGRRFNFSVAIVAGDRRGRVGVGLGKASDTALAMDKALKDARRSMVTVRTTASGSIPHEAFAKFSSARIWICPAPSRGLIAGSALRDCLELAGVKDVNAKVLSGSKNKLNIARAALKALRGLRAPRGRHVAAVAAALPVAE